MTTFELMPDFLDALDEELRRSAGRAPAPDPAPRHRPRASWRAGMAVAAAVVAIVVTALVLGAGDDGRLSLVDKAIAATSGPGVVHWVTVASSELDGGSRMPGQRTEGWARDGVQHVVTSVDVGSVRRIDLDRRIDGRRARVWSSGARGYSTEQVPPTKEQDVPIGDPFAAFRAAHAAGRLTTVGGSRFRVTQVSGRTGRGSTQTLTYTLDPSTGLPRTLTVELRTRPSPAAPRAHRFTTVLRYLRYEVLPDTAANRRLLRFLPHPRR